uniref:Uncharacterized protein n=1 Tax=Arundo donax TaxID=35708 RepID=A0A0A9A2K5_ARUDO
MALISLQHRDYKFSKKKLSQDVNLTLQS